MPQAIPQAIPQDIRRIGFATTNPHKCQETQAILNRLMAPLTVEVVPIETAQTVEETGQTFLANAQLKLAAALSHPAAPLPEDLTLLMAEDSGLVVPSLAGTSGLSPFPGIYSDRWLNDETLARRLLGDCPHEPLTYSHKCQALLRLLDGVADRRASYQAAIAAVTLPEQHCIEAHGHLPLVVAHQASGHGGFGYDPIMAPADRPGQTLASLPADVKNACSHRHMALANLVQQWQR